MGAAPRWNRYDDARTAVIREVLRAVVAGLVAETGRSRLDIVDAGGGTGGSAVPLAGQGDVGALAAVIGDQGADLVLCHSVLEYVDSPEAAMTTVASVLRPGGAVSVLAASAVAAVIHRALAGRFDEARRLLGAVGGPAGGGRAGGGQAGGGPAGGPGRRPGSGADGGAGPRRFTLAEVTGL